MSVRCPGTNIRAVRIAAGLTQRRPAERLGVTQPAISVLEPGREDAAISRVEQALAAMHERFMLAIETPETMGDRGLDARIAGTVQLRIDERWLPLRYCSSIPTSPFLSFGISSQYPNCRRRAEPTHLPRLPSGMCASMNHQLRVCDGWGDCQSGGGPPSWACDLRSFRKEQEVHERHESRTSLPTVL